MSHRTHPTPTSDRPPAPALRAVNGARRPDLSSPRTRVRAGGAAPAAVPFPQPAGLAADPVSDAEREASLSEAELHDARMTRMRLDALQRSAFNAGVAKVRASMRRDQHLAFWQGCAFGAALGGALMALLPHLPAVL
jgi:hypothetical protein